ncbi:hypothetical protein GCM10010923_15580 [Blastomonas marina]|uniref:Uncharacterized protein n=2 Tax=Blastomonas marina TaxID=1867408 RepID=A0ABQ1FD36_9SPHN|nr:hypothetical protein GCM10010923_15580 [Blastomonas marina]
MRAMDLNELWSHIRFASPATHAALWALGLVLLAIFSIWSDNRRVKRSSPDAVGFMPWTFIALASLFVAAGLAIAAVKGWKAA